MPIKIIVDEGRKKTKEGTGLAADKTTAKKGPEARRKSIFSTNPPQEVSSLAVTRR